MSRKAVVFSSIFCVVLVAVLHAQGSRRRGPIVRQVDRILIESAEPRALFDFFSRELLLPEAWPLTENQGHVSGGLGAGNVILEFYRYASLKDVPARRRLHARYSGLALQPYPLSDALRELQTSGIPYSTPEPFIATLPNGTRGVQWTMVPLPSFSKPAMSIFLYEYSPAFLRVEVRRKQLGNRLTLNSGGPLGIQSVREIVIGSSTMEKEKAEWTRLLGDADPDGFWRAGAGPAIRLTQSPQDGIREIALAVKSLEAARTYLAKNRLLGSASANEISLSPAKIQSLRIRLTR